MICRKIACAALMLAGTLAVGDHKNPDDEAVRRLPQAFCTAFNHHNGHEVAEIMADDVDFVTVGAWWIHGRPDFEKYHTRMLSGRFAGIKFEPLHLVAQRIEVFIARSSGLANAGPLPAILAVDAFQFPGCP